MSSAYLVIGRESVDRELALSIVFNELGYELGNEVSNAAKD